MTFLRTNSYPLYLLKENKNVDLLSHKVKFEIHPQFFLMTKIPFFFTYYLFLFAGFLRPGLGRDVVSNFGLLDQIAALHWLKENVGAFGGNPDAVTLVGHGSGASLVSFLMTSPVAKASQRELFQKAILMSGSSLSPMAVSRDPTDITMQVHSPHCGKIKNLLSLEIFPVKSTL